ncbi:porin family protein [Salegentibacter mishustinae]|uniref:outer membrane beta-barrel protein n=1 Tax=Salegentibacter mishustinae TaxID=270918 RepID=UPI001CE1B05B|nr:outer membrane beta-barrel protein [Salegentibacter mishustinae]UBZ08340.1 porin family protein [Salegentibacter mishustinae]
MIKNFFLVFFLFLGVNSFAQNVDFGIQAGYANVEVEANGEGGTQVSVDGSGFYVGILADYQFNENWHLQPSVNYFNVEEIDFLSIPVLVQYYIENSGFYLQAGPQATIVLEDVPTTNEFGLDAAFGIGYHITQDFFIEARYGIELTNRYTDESIEFAEQYDTDIKSGVNTLMIGVGYKF